MFKKSLAVFLAAHILVFTGCGSVTETNETNNNIVLSIPDESNSKVTEIQLSDTSITVDGEEISNDISSAVYAANDIIYYESGKDKTYGEGSEADAHTADEAAAHTVVHITSAGKYLLRGSLSAGQIFVDLGDNAKNDAGAVVTLALDGVDITCSVAPAVFFYNVYECGTKDEAAATSTVDTSTAGANVIIANNSINTVNGAYVARIYKSGTQDTLHKYDGAFYSRQSMNIDGEVGGSGVLHINAENEGLDSEMHLTVNGGNITITAQNDGINTNEDNISVTTINGGALTINAGLGEEGDGIDSNGFIVINDGAILTSSCDKGADGGIDADRDIIINGGTVIACGMQNGTVVSSSKQDFMQISVKGTVAAGANVKISDGENIITEFNAIKSFTSLVLSSPAFESGKLYALSVNGESMEYTLPSRVGPEMGGMQPPMGEDFERRDMQGGRFEMPAVPEGLDEWMENTEIPDDIREWINSMKDMNTPFGDKSGGMRPRENMQMPNA